MTPWWPRTARSTTTPGAYGALRIHADLRGCGHHVNRKRVAQLMREHGIVAPAQEEEATVPDPAAPPAPDLLQRDCTASRRCCELEDHHRTRRLSIVYPLMRLSSCVAAGKSPVGAMRPPTGSMHRQGMRAEGIVPIAALPHLGGAIKLDQGHLSDRDTSSQTGVSGQRPLGGVSLVSDRKYLRQQGLPVTRISRGGPASTA